jgi:type I restriction enzyme R subunit
LIEAGWSSESQIREQYAFTDGRILPQGRQGRRLPGKRADYLLLYKPDLPIAVVEAKAEHLPAANGLQQAIEYAEILGLPFAFASNGRELIAHDLTTGTESRPAELPSPEQLWEQWKATTQMSDEVSRVLLTPSYPDTDRQLRYYQLRAINRAIDRLGAGEEKILLTLATGTGKSLVAFQLCWRLWRAGWNRRQRPNQRPRMLYLADRGVLVDQPMLQHFAPFGDAMHKVTPQTTLGREMYFATYQQIAEDESRPGLFRDYPQDFFDLVIVDECHRGSARADSTWREILDWFSGSAKLGMTATPLRDDTRDTYEYFGTPALEYSLAQGIDDGFLAPYRVRRVVTDVDATGWRPERGELDKLGREIPDAEYGTTDYERRISLTQRTDAMAAWLTDFLAETSPLDKTIVFCVDQEHAQQMRDALVRLNPDQVRQYPDWVCRVTADEGAVGRTHLGNFQDIDRTTPAILTSSELLTTGVDAPTTMNVVLCRVVGSIAEFKQIIGRGTRLRTDYGKWYFTIIDFTGTATSRFADPAFDGEPADVEEDLLDEPGRSDRPQPGGDRSPEGDHPEPDRKFYVDGTEVSVVADVAYELDAEGRRLRSVKYTDFAAEKVRSICRSTEDLRSRWADPRIRSELLDELGSRGIDLGFLAERSGHPSSDAFDLLCHVAFAAPLRTRRERGAALSARREDFWDRYAPEAQAILRALLGRYEELGITEIDLPQVLDLPPLSEMGSVIELIDRFGGAAEMQAAVREMQQLLYAA